MPEIQNPYNFLCVYAVEFGDGTVKIGVSGKPHQRLKQIKMTRRTLGVSDESMKCCVTPPHAEARENEMFLLKECGLGRIHGEYVSAPFWRVQYEIMGVKMTTVKSKEEIERSQRGFDALVESLFPGWGGRSFREFCERDAITLAKATKEAEERRRQRNAEREAKREAKLKAAAAKLAAGAGAVDKNAPQN